MNNIEKKIRDYAGKIGYKSKFFFSSPDKDMNFLFWMTELRKEMRDSGIYIDIFTETDQNTHEVYFNFFIFIDTPHFGEVIDHTNYQLYEDALMAAIEKGLKIYENICNDKAL